MILPTPDDLIDVLEATWPPAARQTVGPWTIRDGRGGGQRVSAATAQAPFTSEDISAAEAAMDALNQPRLFMIRGTDTVLDNELADRGYAIKDPVTLYASPVDVLLDAPIPPISTFPIWPPLHIMRDIWEAGGIGPARVDVMSRVAGAKTGVLSRSSGRASGAAFVAIHHGIAMLHALEVLQTQRRQGAGINMMRAAAKWAQDQGVGVFSLVVTDANVGANALYRGMGMTTVGKYHYRIEQK